MSRLGATQRTWTPCEISTLRTMLRADASWPEIGAALDRTPMSCKSKARDMRMLVGRPRQTAKPAVQAPERPWLYGEDRELAMLISEGHEIGTIAQMLNRSLQSVSNKASAQRRWNEPALPWPTVAGMYPASIAWAERNPSTAEGRMILGMASEPILRVTSDTAAGWAKVSQQVVAARRLALLTEIGRGREYETGTAMNRSAG